MNRGLDQALYLDHRHCRLLGTFQRKRLVRKLQRSPPPVSPLKRLVRLVPFFKMLGHSTASFQACHRRHRDVRRRLHPAWLHQATSNAETPQHLAAKSQRLRRGRRTPLRHRSPPTITNLQRRRPQVGERRRMPPSSDPGVSDLGFPPELPGLGNKKDRNKEAPSRCLHEGNGA
jgi:hypothetical protein